MSYCFICYMSKNNVKSFEEINNDYNIIRNGEKINICENCYNEKERFKNVQYEHVNKKAKCLYESHSFNNLKWEDLEYIEKDKWIQIYRNFDSNQYK